MTGKEKSLLLASWGCVCVAGGTRILSIALIDSICHPGMSMLLVEKRVLWMSPKNKEWGKSKHLNTQPLTDKRRRGVGGKAQILNQERRWQRLLQSI